MGSCAEKLGEAALIMHNYTMSGIAAIYFISWNKNLTEVRP